MSIHDVLSVQTWVSRLLPVTQLPVTALRKLFMTPLMPLLYIALTRQVVAQMANNAAEIIPIPNANLEASDAALTGVFTVVFVVV